MSKNGLTKLLSAILATGLVLQPISGNIGLWTVMAEPADESGITAALSGDTVTATVSEELGEISGLQLSYSVGEENFQQPMVKEEETGAYTSKISVDKKLVSQTVENITVTSLDDGSVSTKLEETYTVDAIAVTIDYDGKDTITVSYSETPKEEATFELEGTDKYSVSGNTVTLDTDLPAGDYTFNVKSGDEVVASEDITVTEAVSKSSATTAKKLVYEITHEMADPSYTYQIDEEEVKELVDYAVDITEYNGEHSITIFNKNNKPIYTATFPSDNKPAKISGDPAFTVTNTEITVAITFDEPVTEAVFKYLVNGEEVSETKNLDPAASTVTFTITPAQNVISTYSNFKVTSVDAFTNEGTENITHEDIVINNTPPEIINTEDNKPSIKVSDDRKTITVVVPFDKAFADAALTFEGTAGGEVTKTTDGNTVTFTIPTAEGTTTTYKNFKATATDANGNTTTKPELGFAEVVIDFTAPTISVETAGNKKSFNLDNGGTIIKVTIKDDTDSDVTYSLSCSQNGEQKVSENGTGKEYTLNATAENMKASGLTDGEVVLKINAKDAYGNVAETFTDTYSIDFTRPEVTQSEVSKQLGNRHEGYYRLLTLTFSEPMDIDSIVIKDNKGNQVEYDSITAVDETNTKFSLRFSAESGINRGNKDKYKINGKDLNGNAVDPEAQGTGDLFIDAEGPSINPSNKETAKEYVGDVDISNTEITYEFTVNDDSIISAIKYLITDEALGEDLVSYYETNKDSLTDHPIVAGSQDQTVSITVPAYGQFYIWAEDEFGNIGTYEYRSLVIEDNKPTVKIDAPTSAQTLESHTVTLTFEDSPKDGENYEGSGLKEYTYTLTDENDEVVSEYNETVNINEMDDSTTLETLKGWGSDTEELTIKDLNGTYTLTVTVKDQALNVSDAASVTLTFCNLAPGAEVKLNNEVVDGDASETAFYGSDNKPADIQITLNAIDQTVLSETVKDPGGVTVADYEITIEDEKGNKVTDEALKLVGTGTTAEETFTVKQTDLDAAGFEDGIVTITINAKNSAGNEITEKEVKFAYDSTNPVISVSFNEPSVDGKTLNDSDVDYYNAEKGKIEATFTLVDNNFGSDMIFSGYIKNDDFVSEETSVPFTWTDPIEENNFEGEEEYTATVTVDTDGAYKFIVRGTDKAGNPIVLADEDTSNTLVPNGTGAFWTPDVKILDTVAPTATVTYLDPVASKLYDKEIYYNSNINVQIDINDTFGEDHYMTYYLENMTYGNSLSGSNTDKSETESNPESEDTINVTLTTDGHYQVWVYGTDNAGNKLMVTEKIGELVTEDAAEHDEKYTPVQTAVKDTKAPVLNIIYPTRTDIDPFVYEEDKEVYYKDPFTVKYEYSDEDITGNTNTLDFKKLFYSYGLTTSDTQVKGNASGSTDNFEIGEKDADGHYQFKAYGIDKAGNALEINEYVEGMEDNKQNTSGVSADTYAPKYAIIKDTVGPTLNIGYSSSANVTGHLYNADGDSESLSDAGLIGYYNKPVTITLTFNDVEKLDGNKMFTKDSVAEDATALSTNSTSAVVTYTADDNDHEGTGGRYQYVAYGTDRAGNGLVVSETIPGEAKDVTEDKDHDAGNPYTTKYTVVFDDINPEFTFDLTAVSGNESVDENNMAYYGSVTKTLAPTLTIDELNFDGDKAGMIILTASPERYADATADQFSVSADEKVYGMNASDGQTYKAEASSEGTYRFYFEGEDKAGNKLVKSAAEAAETDYQATSEYNKGFWTYTKALDFSVDGIVEISNASGEKYYTNTFAQNNASGTNIYRSEDKANIYLNATNEKSPYYITFKVSTSLEDNILNLGDTTYNYSARSNDRNGEQIFNITEATIMDRAGNTYTINDLSKIYLDKTNPKAYDVDYPRASIQAKATSDITARTADGRDLYGDNVTINLSIEDPSRNQENRLISSGLKKVHYVVKADGTVVAENTADPEELNDPSKYTWNKSLTISNDTNNIEVELWAFDNADNESNHATYKFGIDKTAPIITVTYDNNSAQNEKYFKENRTATVTIQDRNIDFSKIKVTTQVGYSGLSAASANGSGVGNDDTRTFTIPYTTDGDYTLEITGTDAVNHPATVNYEGTAPRDFVLDKTKPIMTVTFNNNDVQNGKYYREGRVATVSIVEHNFSDAGYVEAAKNASIQRGTTGFPGQSGFSSNGDNRTNTYNFSQDGNYSFTLNYTDLAGNEAETVVVDEFVVDQTPPIVQFDETTVRDNMITNGDIMPTIIFDDTNFSASLINFVLNGAKITDRNSFAVSRALGEFGGTVTYSNFEVTKENDDIYTLTATITDLAGNTGTATVRFSVNRFGSTFEAINGTEDLLQQYYTNTSKSVFIRELNVNDLTEYTVTINRDGTNETLKEGTDFRVTVNTVDGGKEYIYEIFESVFEREGVYTVTIQSVDETGNVNSNSTVRRDGGIDDYPITFVVDKTAPSNLINELLSGVRPSKNIFNAASKDIHISFTDNIARAHIIVEVDGVKVLDLSGDELRDHLEANNGEIVFNVGAKDNYQHIVITSYDAAGNESEVVEYDVLVSANALVRFYNNKPVFYGSLAGLLALILFILFLLKRKKDDDEEENKA